MPKLLALISSLLSWLSTDLADTPHDVFFRPFYICGFAAAILCFALAAYMLRLQRSRAQIIPRAEGGIMPRKNSKAGLRDMRPGFPRGALPLSRPVSFAGETICPPARPMDITIMARPLQWFADVMPLTYSVDAMQQVTAQASWTSAHTKDIVIVLAFAVAALLLAAITIRRQVKP